MQQQSKKLSMPLAKSIAKTAVKAKKSMGGMDDEGSLKNSKKESGAKMVIKSIMATNKTLAPKNKAK